MTKKITLVLNTTPYNYENSYTAMKIAEAALDRGLDTHLVASTDGVYCFLKGQEGKGMPNAARGFRSLMDKGLKVSLWTGCINFRCNAEENYIEGPERGGCVDGRCSIEKGAEEGSGGGTMEKGTLKGLFSLMKETDIFINLGV